MDEAAKTYAFRAPLRNLRIERGDVGRIGYARGERAVIGKKMGDFTAGIAAEHAAALRRVAADKGADGFVHLTGYIECKVGHDGMSCALVRG